MNKVLPPESDPAPIVNDPLLTPLAVIEARWTYYVREQHLDLLRSKIRLAERAACLNRAYSLDARPKTGIFTSPGKKTTVE